MTDFPYTDTDLRVEAARQYAEVLRAPDRLEVQDEMQGTPIPSRSGDGQTVRWGQLSGDDLHDAANDVHELLDDAPDLSRWAINLSGNVLTRTTELAWGHGNNWHLAVQVAHRRGVDDELHTALIDAVRGAVSLVLDERGLSLPQTTQQTAPEEATR